MKTKEFIEKVEKLGCEVEVGVGVTVNAKGIEIAYVSGQNQYEMTTLHAGRMSLSSYVKEPGRLFDLIVEYARTPLEEREEPKKYYLRLPDVFTESCYSYLNYITDGFGILSGFRFDSQTPSKFNQTQFTQEEIDAMPNQEFIKTLIKEEVE